MIQSIGVEEVVHSPSFRLEELDYSNIAITIAENIEDTRIVWTYVENCRTKVLSGKAGRAAGYCEERLQLVDVHSFDDLNEDSSLVLI